MASASAMQLHTCFAFGMCSPVTFMRKLTCLAGPELRESLQEVDSIAAWPGLDEKMSQIDFSVPVITSLYQLFYCVCSFRINHSSGRVSHLKNPKLLLNILAFAVLSFARHGKEATQPTF